MKGERVDVIIIDDIETRVTGTNVAVERARRSEIVMVAKAPERSFVVHMINNLNGSGMYPLIEPFKYKQSYRDLEFTKKHRRR